MYLATTGILFFFLVKQIHIVFMYYKVKHKVISLEINPNIWVFSKDTDADRTMIFPPYQKQTLPKTHFQDLW